MADKGQPLVSVVVRTKNRPGLLKTALKSIAAQDHRPIEVVLVNDGGCALEIETIKTVLHNCDLCYVHFQASKGRAAAGNAGIAAAKGKYIGFLDDDDEFLPDHLSSLVACLNENGNEIAYADTEIVSQAVDVGVGRTEIKERKIFASYDFSYKDLVIENYIPLISILFLTDVLKQVGGFDTEFDLYEDWDLLLRLGEHISFHHIRKATSIYNQWNKASQIAQATEPQILQRASAWIYRKHQNKMNPDVILNLKQKHGIVVNELKTLQKKFAYLESELTARDSEKLRQKDAELRQKDAELRQKDAELRQRDAELRQRDAELHHIASVLAQKSHEVERLSSQVTHLTQWIDQIQSTLGWQLLQKVREFRGRVLPPETARGKIYQKIIKRLKGARAAR